MFLQWTATFEPNHLWTHHNGSSSELLDASKSVSTSCDSSCILVPFAVIYAVNGSDNPLCISFYLGVLLAFFMFGNEESPWAGKCNIGLGGSVLARESGYESHLMMWSDSEIHKHRCWQNCWGKCHFFVVVRFVKKSETSILSEAGLFLCFLGLLLLVCQSFFLQKTRIEQLYLEFEPTSRLHLKSWPKS